jgi:hypothetical protein
MTFDDLPDPAQSPVTPFTVRLNGPGLAAAVPSLLGYHPTDRLVVLFFQQGRIVLTVAVPLADPRTPDKVGEVLTRLVTTSQADTFAFIAYADASAERLVADCARTAPLPIRDVLRVEGGRLWDLTAADPDHQGIVLPPDPLAPIRALHGKTVAASREAVADCLSSAAPEVIAEVSAQLLSQRSLFPSTALHRYAALDHARRDRADGPVPLEEMEAARLLSCLEDPLVRDACACWDDDGWWLWLDLIPLAPPSHVPVVATMIAVHAYLREDTVMAKIAAEHALAVDSRYRLALLVLTFASSAEPPQRIARKLRAASARALADLITAGSPHPTADSGHE